MLSTQTLTRPRTETNETYAAVRAILSKGLSSEEILQRHLNKTGPTKAYELAQALRWTPGKTHATITRLLKKKLIRHEIRIENGRTQKIVQLVPYRELLTGER